MLENKLLYYILIVLFLTSCGTIKKADNIIAIDSSPRGMQVYDDHQQLIGTTPFFKKISPRYSQVFSFKLNGEMKQVKYKCGINQSQSILPALLLFPAIPIGTILGSSFILLDLFTGGIYDCSDPLLWDIDDEVITDLDLSRSAVKNKVDLKNDIVLAKNILILPIIDKDEIYSDKLAFAWIKNIFNKKNKSADKIITYYTTKAELSTIGINNVADQGRDKMKSTKLNFMARKHKATHFIHFEKKIKGGRVYYTPRLYDAFTTKEEHALYLKKLIVRKRISQNIFLDTFIDIINILPNAFTVSHGELTEIENLTKIEGVQSAIGPHPQAVPQILTAFTMEHINHPQYFSDWGISAGFSPSFSTSSWHQTLRYQDEVFSYRLYTLNVFYNAGFSLHTPFGSPNMSIGMGMINLIGKDDHADSFNKVVSGVRIDINYVIFLTHRYYLKLDIQTFRPAENSISRDIFEFDGWSEGSLAIGYYYPELKSVIRNIFHF